MIQVDPSSIGKDEYGIGEKILNAIAQQGMSSIMDEDWNTMQNILKGALFKFLNNEIVKKTKLFCLSKMEE